MTAAHEKYCKDPKDEGEEIPPSSYPFEQEQKENHYPESEKSAHRHHEAKIHNTNGAGSSN